MGIVWFILILGAIILVHEFGHFIFSKLFGVYVYEFSLGMGPKILHYKKKGGETEYCLRLIPIGGFVSLAGEDADDNKKIPEDRKLYTKPVWKRLIIMIAGATFNFIFAFVLLFVMALIYGSVSTKPIVATVSEDYPAYEAGIKEGDRIISIDDQKVSSWSEVQLYIGTSKGNEMDFVIKDKEGNKKEITVKPDIVIDEEGKESYVVGIGLDNTIRRGFKESIIYACETTISLYKLMLTTLKQLFTGGVSVNDLSGPVGIYSVVNTQSKEGLQSIMYLTAYLSMNVGVINLIPFPAFDGGRVLFLIIEKIRRKPIKAKTEGIINSIGFGLLMLLMLYVTFNDILRLF
ncbi:MAG: RIP metalloprotease RseP [Bacilli bacterium]|nr:RIP metalloprotease RseP [Bacilli bacterium]